MRPYFSILQSKVEKYHHLQNIKSGVFDNQLVGFIVGDRTFYLSRKAIKNSGLLSSLSDVVLNEHTIDLRPKFNDVESFQYVCSFLNLVAGYDVVLPSQPDHQKIKDIFHQLQIKCSI